MEKQPLSGKKILVTGGAGFIGHHLMPILDELGAEALPISRRFGFDLTHESEALASLLAMRPDIVVHLAAFHDTEDRPGIHFRNNLLMGMNVVHATAMARARLVILGTMGSYPGTCEKPLREEDFWEGYPEPHKAPYGMAKKALWVMCDAYRRQYGLPYVYLVPGSAYGPFETQLGTVGALVAQMLRAQEQEGKTPVVSPQPEKATESLVYAGDVAMAIAKACITLEHYDGILNLSDDKEVPISDLAGVLKGLCGYKGKIKWPSSNGNGAVQRAMDGTRATEVLGWKPQTSLEEGLHKTVEWHISLRKTD